MAGDPRDEVPGGLFADPRDKPGDAADLLDGRQWLALGMQGLASLAAERLPCEWRLDPVQLVGIGDRLKTHDLPILLRQHVAREIVPQVKPEGWLSCSRCMIRMMAPDRVSLSRPRGCGRTSRWPPGAELATRPPRVSRDRR